MVIYCDYMDSWDRLGVETNTLDFFSNLPLDIESWASYAYSMRRMSIYYTGNCIRVRRSSDNVEQDFGFVGNLVDDASIVTFLGWSTWYIAVWYDQSGNNNDVTIAAVAAQPTYVSSWYNGKPAAHSITGAQIFGLATRKPLWKNYTLVAHSALDVVDSWWPTFSLWSSLFGQSWPHNSWFSVFNTDILRSVSWTSGMNIWDNANDWISHDLFTFKTYNSSRNWGAELKVNYDGNTLTPHNYFVDLDASFQYLNSRFAGDGWWLGQHQEFIVYENTVSDDKRTEIDKSINTFF
jgi:hypothetical protein